VLKAEVSFLGKGDLLSYAKKAAKNPGGRSPEKHEFQRQQLANSYFLYGLF
jgi:hypothetical protein